MRKLYLTFLALFFLGSFVVQSANVNPIAGKWYNLVQSPSEMNIGLSGTTRPSVNSPSTDLSQVFEFVAVEGLTDTYYIRSANGMYLNKDASSNWNMIYETASNGTSSEWVIMDVDTSLVAFRLFLNFNQKYVATDGITDGSYLYCDKASTHANGVFYLKEADNPQELNIQHEALDLGDISAVTENLTLPTSLGSNGVTVVWQSSNKAIIDTLGNVTQPAKFDQFVTLTATLSLTLSDKVYTLNKIFKIKVLGAIGTPEIVAKWDFSAESIEVVGDTVTVSDVSGAAYNGKLLNDATIRTMGTSTRVNVLDLGNGTGYFDMGEAVGEVMYTLGDYTISGYFYIDSTYAQLTSNGNFMYVFSNTADAPVDQNGYLLGRLNDVSMEITPKYYATNNQGVYQGAAAPKGAWHHYAYVQNGTTGTIYLDGVAVKTGSITNFPYTSLPVEGRTGTLYNWLGRANYPSDAYLRNTLLYDFTVYSIPLTGDNLILDIGVPSTIEMLNTAYAENPNVKDATLETEYTALSLGDISALSSNITLPTQGSSDTEVSISWTSSNTDVIDNLGNVKRPNYHDVKVILTATLAKGIQTLTKDFEATVLMEPGTGFTSDLLVRFDFSNTLGNIVTDLGEKKIQGILMNDAKVREIGTDESGKFMVLDLYDSIGYFDMGLEVGKILAGVQDYTMSAFFRIDENYLDLSLNGNFLWNFSNTNNVNLNPNAGYIFASLKTTEISESTGNWSWANGNRAVNIGTTAPVGAWHNITYTQTGNTGTLYIDGMPSAVADTMINTPAKIFSQFGKNGSPYNWLAKSCYEANGDVYLRQTLIHDFRIYNRALSDIEILALELNVGEVLTSLDAAYLANSNATNSVQSTRDGVYKMQVVDKVLTIENLNGSENIQVFDLAGRPMASASRNQFKLSDGIYIVKVDQSISKIIIR